MTWFDGFTTTLDLGQWAKVQSGDPNITIEAATVKTVGIQDWWYSSFYRIPVGISGSGAGQGIQVEFKLSGANPQAAFALQTASGAYRILGLIIENNRIYARYRADGATYVKPAELINPVQQNVWYVLRLQVLPSGVGTIEVWQKDDPTVRGAYVAPMPDGAAYQFRHWMYQGTSWLDNYQEFDLVAPNTRTTSYQYDVLDRLVRVTDTLGISTVITYNLLGQKTGMLDPDMGPWGYAYDPAGNLQTQTDARNCVTTFGYDLLSRLTSKTYAGLGACGTTTPVSYQYGLTGNGAGQRVGMVDSAGITAWQYDARGQVITETRTITGTGSFTTAFRYDAAGRVITTTYPTGEVITQSYNLASQLVQMRSSTYVTNYVSGLLYNAFGQPVTATLGNGVVVANSYDPRSGRLLATVSKIGSTPRLDLAYAYDQGGNVTQIVDAVRSETSAFTYDMLDRLLTSAVSVSGVGLVRQETYAYTATGNIQAVTRWPETTHLGYGTVGNGAVAANSTRGGVTGLSGGAASLAFVRGGEAGVPLGGAWVSASYYYSNSLHIHAVTGLSSGASFSYDANGNMIGRVEGGRVYTQTFDAENRLVSVIQQGVGTTQYVYDGDGQLTMQVNPGGTGRLYLGVVEYELNTNGTTAGSTSYYALPGARAVRTGAGLFYVLADHLGSASVSLDGGGAVVAEMRYDAFGATRWSVGTMPGDRLYTGQVWAEVGLYYFHARWYSPYLNRFVSADNMVPRPLDPQSFNRYSMVLNNPLKYTDPTGHDACFDFAPDECVGNGDNTPYYVHPELFNLEWWELILLQATIYAATSNGTIQGAFMTAVAHVLLNRAIESGSVTARLGTTELPILLSDLGIARPTTQAQWIAAADTIRSNVGLPGSDHEAGWRESGRVAKAAINNAARGIDPTHGSTEYTALTRIQADNESRSSFQERFWHATGEFAGYYTRVDQYRRYARQHPDFRWSVTKPFEIYMSEDGRLMSALFTANDPCNHWLGNCSGR